MKTIIFSIMILCATATCAQVTVKGGVGNSFAVNTRVVELDLAAHYKGFGIAGGVIAHTNMQADQHALFNGTFSIIKQIKREGLSYVNLQMGYCYQLATTDTKDGAQHSLIGKFAYVHTINEGYQGAHWYISTASTGNYTTVTFGLMGIFK